MKKYGYVRVSTKDQHIDRQMSAMLEQKIPSNQIFVDKESGKDFKRRRYQVMLRHLQKDDELFIKSIDRLGRNYEEIIEQWNLLTKLKNVHIIVLDCPLLDTRNKVNGLTGKFIADLVLQILSYVAQVERENIRQRQKEGIREAISRGVKFGRSAMGVPLEFSEIASDWSQGDISLRKGAKILGVSPQTFSKWLKHYDTASKCDK